LLRDEELRRLKLLEDKKVERMGRELSAWQKATEIRAYADAVEAACNARFGETVPKENLDWIEWLRKQADRVDPIRTI
jgi:hypothetical protein